MREVGPPQAEVSIDVPQRRAHTGTWTTAAAAERGSMEREVLLRGRLVLGNVHVLICNLGTITRYPFIRLLSVLNEITKHLTEPSTW